MRTWAMGAWRWGRILVLGSCLPLLATCNLIRHPTEPAQGTHGPPPPPPPASGTLSGRVELSGFLVDDQGGFTGTRDVEDADGIQVELISGDQVVATTSTVDGAYRFPDLAPGSYRVRTSVIGSIADESDVHLDQSSVEAGTLRLTSSGNVVPAPNPSTDAVRIDYSVQRAQAIELRIQSLQGTTVRTLVSGFMTRGDHSTLWDGRDSQGNSVTSMVWVTYQGDSQVRVHLLFR